MKYFYLLFALLILASCEQAQTETVSEPSFSFKSDFATTWERSRKYTLALADSMPEGRESFDVCKHTR